MPRVEGDLLSALIWKCKILVLETWNQKKKNKNMACFELKAISELTQVITSFYIREKWDSGSFSIVESHPTTHSKVEFVARIPYLLYHQASFHSEGKPTALSVLPCLRQSSVLIVEYFSDWEIQKNYKEYNWKGKLPLGHVIMQIPTTFNSTMKERCSLPAALGRLFKDLL